jgi:asparagine synthase (glutamine-hydrolysing)
VDGRAELVQKLGAKEPVDLRASTDVELILHAYHVWGEGCVKHLLGDFAFAIWDSHRKRLFCARDHFGVKLFYYARVANCLIFSNTLNCIRLHPGVTDKLNELAIGDFLLFGYNTELSTTTFSDIKRLPPAHELTLSEGNLRANRYWYLSTDGHIIRYKRADNYVDHFKELLREAVGDRLRADRVAIFMSGGLDSPSLAAAACELRANGSAPVDLQAYCTVYDEYPDEERYYSRLVAETIGIPIHYKVADRYTMFERWDNPRLRRPEPYDWPLLAMSYDSLKTVMAHSRVVLYGEDGDALLFPSSVVDMLKGKPFARVIAEVGWFVLSHRRRPPLGLRLLARVKRWMGKHRNGSPYPTWLNQDFAARLDLPARWKKNIKAEPSRLHPLRHEAVRRLTSSFWQTIFESNDPGVTLVPVEHRLPLLDLRLVNYLLAIPPLPCCVNKELLRAAMCGTLPEPVCRRPKTPLAFDPYQVRLREDDARWIDEFRPRPELSRYVKREAVPRVTGKAYDPAESSWIHLRPLILNYWLQYLEPVG